MAERSHKGLVLRDVKVKRGGKTFTQKRWVKAGDDEPKPKKDKKVDLISQLKLGDIVNVGGKLSKVKSINEKGRVVILHNDVLGDEVYDFDKLNKIGKLETPEGRFKPNKPIKFMGKDLIIKKVSESEKTIKLSDGKVYTFGAIEKGSKGKDKKIKIKPKKIDTKDLSKQMELYKSGIKFHPDGNDMITAVSDYSDVNYVTINSYLRDEKSGDTKNDKEIEHISNFLKYAPKFKGEVYRGMSFGNNEKGFNDFLNEVKKGKSVMMKAFTSTSTDEKMISEFKKGERSVTLKIKSKSGVFLNGLAEVPEEKEVLFDKKSKFNIIKIDKSNQNHPIIIMEEM